MRTVGAQHAVAATAARERPVAGTTSGQRPAGLATVFTSERVLLAATLFLAALLRFAALERQGFGNTYYAAAVQSMLANWRAFFFASFDPGGFVTVDKPPLGLWVQSLSAWLFGFSGVSLFLPQALAGVLSVALTYATVRRAFGAAAGLLAALLLAITPVAVVVDRNNSHDALVVLAMLGALWAATRAAAGGDLRWLLVATICIGLGFNVKMLQAYLVLPAVYAVYGLTAARPWRTRVGHLLLATVVLLSVSLSWSALVDLIPAGERPFVGSSGTNSALSLALGYNGLGRMAQAVGAGLGTVDLFGLRLDLAEAPGFDPWMGEPGPLRLFNPGLAGQIAWFLPLAAVGLIVAAWQTFREASPAGAFDEASHRTRVRAVLGWGGWWLTQVAFFSTADFFHSYYLVSLAPATAALAAIGLALLWPCAGSGWRGAIGFATAVLTTAVVQIGLLGVDPAWQARIGPFLVAGGLLAIIAAAASAFPLLPRGLAAGSAVAVLLMAPLAWSVVGVAAGAGGAWIPRAGPRGMIPAGLPAFPPSGALAAMTEQRDLGGFTPTLAGPGWNVLDPGLVDYLGDRHGSARYLVATETASFASVFMLAAGEPALALGGYQGWDEIVSPIGLAEMVDRGEVRFFWLDSASARGSGVNADLVAWVTTNCAPIPPTAWGARSSPDADVGTMAPMPGMLGDTRGRAADPRSGANFRLFDCLSNPQPIAKSTEPRAK